jgi:hypothetical protein
MDAKVCLRGIRGAIEGCMDDRAQTLDVLSGAHRPATGERVGLASAERTRRAVTGA